MKSWKDKLPASQAAFVQDIVDQIPEAMGARNVFVNALDQLAGVEPPAAGASANPIFRYAIVTASADVIGTNDEPKAREFADDEGNFVIDTTTCTWLVSANPSDDSGLSEAP